jgi:hypothetical protein
MPAACRKGPMFHRSIQCRHQDWSTIIAALAIVNSFCYSNVRAEFFSHTTQRPAVNTLQHWCCMQRLSNIACAGRTPLPCAIGVLGIITDDRPAFSHHVPTG